MKRVKINKIIKFSNVDGPGNRMSIFFQGCNYNCLYCHNPETINICNNCALCVEGCPVGALKLVDSKVLWNEKVCIECDHCIELCDRNSTPKTQDVSIEELVEEIKKVSKFIRGITVSGGEATLYYEFITKLFVEVKKLGLTTFVDTNGGVDLSKERYRKFLEVTDKFMLDVKVWDGNTHKYLVENENKNVIKNLKFLGESGKLYEVRTVIVPKILDNMETVDKVSEIIGDINSKNKVENIMYKIIKYRKIGVRKEILKKELLNIETPTDEDLKEILEVLEKNRVEKFIII